MAAAAALFMCGFAASEARRAWYGTPAGRNPVSAGTGSGGPAHAAEEVQRLGSEWTASLARLARSNDSTGPLARQEREVALATMRGAVSELARIAPGQASVAAYTAITDEHRKSRTRANGGRGVAF